MNVTTLWYWAQNAAKTKKNCGCNYCRNKGHDCKNDRTTEMIAEIPILQYHLK